MKFAAFATILSLISSSVNAQLQNTGSNNGTVTDPSQNGGPLDFAASFPQYTYTGNPSSGLDHGRCNWTMVANSNAGVTFLTNQVTVFTVYYGSGLSTRQQNVITHFIRNVGQTNFWKNVVRGYNFYGQIAGWPVFQLTGVSNVTVSTSVAGTSLTAPGSDNSIFQNAFGQTGFNYQTSAYYLMILGSDISYTSSLGKVLGTDICGMHYLGTSSYPQLSYSVVGLRSGTDNCNSIITSAVDGDVPLANLVNFVLHELVETIIAPPVAVTGGWASAFFDACHNQPMDKCQNLLINLQTLGTSKFNLALGPTYFTVNPVWDVNSNICSLGSTANNQTFAIRNPYQNFARCFKSPDNNVGTAIQIYDCDNTASAANTPSEQLTYDPINKRLKFTSSGLCLANIGTNDGTQVTQQTCGGSGNQVWTYNLDDHSLRPSNANNLCIQYTGGIGNYANGVNLLITACVGGYPQMWVFY